jgi:hypothetical protein
MSYDYIIANDPGVTGGFAVLENKATPKVYNIPIMTIVVNKKKKNIYDIKEIAKIFSPYQNKKVLYVQEKVGVHMGEGSVSSFNFGKSSGATLGVAYAFGFDVVEVTPQKWKKNFPELITDLILDKKAEMKDLRVIGKRIKEKDDKKANKKQIDKLGREVKKEAKIAARELVSNLYPSLAALFTKTNSDGIAESLLIALYGKEKQNELV